MKNSYSQEDAVLYLGKEGLIIPSDWPESCLIGYESRPTPSHCSLRLSNENGSVKIPLSQETINQLKEKGFI